MTEVSYMKFMLKIGLKKKSKIFNTVSWQNLFVVTIFWKAVVITLGCIQCTGQ